MGIKYSRIKKQMRRSLAPDDPGKYNVRENPEERFYFRFRLVLAGVVLFFVVLLLPIRDARSKGGWKINTSRLKNYERLLPGRRLVLAYVKYLKERM